MPGLLLIQIQIYLKFILQTKEMHHRERKIIQEEIMLALCLMETTQGCMKKGITWQTGR
jgi:hypothetical protein